MRIGGGPVLLRCPTAKQNDIGFLMVNGCSVIIIGTQLKFIYEENSERMLVLQVENFSHLSTFLI